MKRKPTTTCLGLSAALGILAALPALAQAPGGASVDFTPAPAPAFRNVEFADPGNGVWQVLATSDFSIWSPIATCKVNNSHFSFPLTVDPESPRLFFRASYDPANQSAPNGIDDALLLPASLHNYANPTLPPHFRSPQIAGQDNTPLTNPITDPGATLGRVLFYDKRLSANNSISCSSCHQQEHGFSDPRQFSVGFEGGLTGRNSMGLTNAKYYPRGHFFWDERAATLEDQVLGPIQNEVEMGLTLPELATKVGAEQFYQELFTETFGDATVTSDRISRSLAQFVRSIVSTNSKYDQGIPVNFTNFTPQENRGRQIFNGVGNCNACHGTDNFVPNNVFNNGLENPYTDPGVGGITGNPADDGKFKVPSLRNIEFTAPYMHDGRFASLEQVVEFYNSGVVDHPNLAPQLRLPPPPPMPGGPPPAPGPPRRLNLLQADKDALLAFLKTLSDPTPLTDEKFSDPFNYGGN